MGFTGSVSRLTVMADAWLSPIYYVYVWMQAVYGATQVPPLKCCTGHFSPSAQPPASGAGWTKEFS